MNQDFTDLSSDKGAQVSYSVAKARIGFKLNSSLSLMRERRTRQIKVVFNWFGLNTLLTGLNRGQTHSTDFGACRKARSIKPTKQERYVRDYSQLKVCRFK